MHGVCGYRWDRYLTQTQTEGSRSAMQDSVSEGLRCDPNPVKCTAILNLHIKANSQLLLVVRKQIFKFNMLGEFMTRSISNV